MTAVECWEELVSQERACAEKAEAERDEYKRKARLLREVLARVTIPIQVLAAVIRVAPYKELTAKMQHMILDAADEALRELSDKAALRETEDREAEK